MNRSDDSIRLIQAGDGASSGAASAVGMPGGSDVASSLEPLDATGRLGRDEIAWITGHGLAAMERAGARGRVRVRFVDDAEMSAAHLEFLEIEGTTDVLTFDMSDEEGLDVDILACVDEAQRRCGEFRHDRARELLLYIVHGVLHCLGHDDHDEDSARRMHEREDEILRAIGVGGVYAPGDRAGADGPAGGRVERGTRSGGDS
jgi:probable rRNA maturation factor